MVDFRPFHGYIPNLAGEEIADRVSPPYDIIGPAELKELQSHPYNVTRITLGGRDESYETAARELLQWISSGKLVRDERPSYYLYKQTFQDDGKSVSRMGIVGVLRVEPYEKGGIIPHEETFPKVKEDRLNLLRATKTHLESIFGLYERSSLDFEELEERAEPLFEFQDKFGTTHSFSRVADQESVRKIQEELRGKKILIADGHHRYETALRYSTENPGDEKKAYVLCTMVSSQDKGMFVRPTHRLIRNLKVQEGDLLEKMSKFLNLREVKSVEDMTKALASASRPTFGLWFPQGKMYVAEYNGPEGDILWSVDAYVCQEILLKDVIYSFPQSNEIQIEYDHDIDSIAKRMASKEIDLAILIRPPSLELVWKVAESGRKMPKKTTYFWPKIWSGLVIYRME